MFETNLIRPNNDKVDALRVSVAVVASIVPIVGIFTAGAVWPTSSDSAATVQGRPPSWFFAFMWTVIVLMLSFVAIISSLNMLTVASLVGLLVLVLLFTVVAIGWLWYYNHRQDKNGAALTLGLAVLVTVLLYATVSTSQYQDDASTNVTTRTLNSTLVAFPLVWCSYALLLNMFDANR